MVDIVTGEIIVALIAFLGTLAGSYSGFKLTAYRVDQLEKKVSEHNNYAKRMPVVEEQIKVINHRLEDLEREAGVHHGKISG